MRGPLNLLCLIFLIFILAHANDHYDGSIYDYSAYTQCKTQPEAPLYDGGILNSAVYHKTETGFFSPSFVLVDLNATTRYSFSCWVKVKGANSTIVKARLYADDSTLICIGTVSAKNDCWSFLKGGFVLDSSSKTSLIFFEITSDTSDTEILVASGSLQGFTVEQWEIHQEKAVKSKRMRAVTVHVSDTNGSRISGASVSIRQLSKEFPFGSAIAKTILGNIPYQTWFAERFNAAVFENELKWYVTEPEQGKLNYTLADQMLDFVHSNQILVRGHNIFWEDPKYTPSWVRNLTTDPLKFAVGSRISSLMSRYRGDFVHWDVNNEMLHFDFYEQRLGKEASNFFFDIAQKSDPLATMFMNDFNVVETCDDVNSGVDSYVERLREINKGGEVLEGIGLEGHFSKPNVVLMRAVLDKLATMKLPIWLTEIDISNNFDSKTQAVYLEEVLREGYSHPAVDGIILWSALHPNGCYQMCLTDTNLTNLPAGDVVDKLLQEWQTKEINGSTDNHGLYSFQGFLGAYEVSATYANRSRKMTLALSPGDETKHLNIQL